MAKLEQKLGFDKPLPVQYGLFLINAIQGDLGNSITKKAPVTQIIGERIPVTLFLIVYATLIGLLITFPLAILSALYPDRRIDHIIRIGSMLFFGMPSFWLGLLLISTFWVDPQMVPDIRLGRWLFWTSTLTFLACIGARTGFSPYVDAVFAFFNVGYSSGRLY